MIYAEDGGTRVWSLPVVTFFLLLKINILPFYSCYDSSTAGHTASSKPSIAGANCPLRFYAIRA